MKLSAVKLSAISENKSVGTLPQVYGRRSSPQTSVRTAMWCGFGSNPMPTKRACIQLTFAKDYPRKTGLPNFKMLDEVTYMTPDTSTHNLFSEPPVYMPPGIQSLEQFNKLTTQQPASLASLSRNGPAGGYNTATIEKEDSEGDMIFRATVSVGDTCAECIVVLKQSFHPNWRATIDGKSAPTITVFPFYLATLVPAGTHEIVFSYEPSRLKVFLLSIEAIIIIAILRISLYRRSRESTGK